MRVGRGTEEGVQIGPLIDDRAVAKSAELVADAVGARRDGPRRRRGDRRRVGTFFAPTVVSGVVAGSDILREEIFGPVLAIATFADEDEAVRLANATEYGLVSYVFTRDLARGHRMIDRLETGMMGLNVGRDLECGRALWRRQAVRHRPRGRPRGHSRVPVDQIHNDPRRVSGTNGEP